MLARGERKNPATTKFARHAHLHGAFCFFLEKQKSGNKTPQRPLCLTPAPASPAPCRDSGSQRAYRGAAPGATRTTKTNHKETPNNEKYMPKVYKEKIKLQIDAKLHITRNHNIEKQNNCKEMQNNHKEKLKYRWKTTYYPESQE